MDYQTVFEFKSKWTFWELKESVLDKNSKKIDDVNYVQT